MIATHGTASHVERLVCNYRQVKRSEALAQDKQHRALRECNWYIDDDCSYVLKARLSSDQGASVAQALDAALGAMREEQQNAVEDLSADTSLATATRDATENVPAEMHLRCSPGTAASE